MAQHIDPGGARPPTDEEILTDLEMRRREILERAADEDRPLTPEEQRELDDIDRERNRIIDQQEQAERQRRQQEEDEASGLTGEELDARDRETLTGEEIDARDGLIPWREAPEGSGGGGTGGGTGDGSGTGGGSGDGDGSGSGGGSGDGGGSGGGGGGDEMTADGADDNPHGFGPAFGAGGIGAHLPGLEGARPHQAGDGVTDPASRVGEGADDNPRTGHPVVSSSSQSLRHPIPPTVHPVTPHSDPRVTDPNPEEA